MSQPSPKRETPFARLMRIIRGDAGQTARTRAQRRVNTTSSSTPAPASPAPASVPQPTRFLRAFWTFASVLSLIVNIVLIAILFVGLRYLGTIQLTANDQFSGILGGLYINFLKMDEASIITEIPINTTIPINFDVPVKTTTVIYLAETTIIPNARVKINTGGVDIDADAVVTLPAGQPLRITLDFPLNVRKDDLPVQLKVPVNIKLKDTGLHEPFIGLQQVVRPLYCLVEPNAVWNNVQLCSPLLTP